MQFSTAYTQFSYQLLFQTCVYEESGRIINVNKSDIKVKQGLKGQVQNLVVFRN